MTRHSYDCRVRWSDVDSYGHVNNVKYFEYYQEARISFLSSALGEHRDVAGTEGMVVARLVVDYRKPILFQPEPLAVESWVTRIGTSSYDLAARILDGSEQLSSAQATLVAYDAPAGRSRRLTESERQALEAAYEG